jgi:hypothetical protein
VYKFAYKYKAFLIDDAEFLNFLKTNVAMRTLKTKQNRQVLFADIKPYLTDQTVSFGCSLFIIIKKNIKILYD